MTDEDILREANDLARSFYALHGCHAREGYRFDQATHPIERLMWRMAVAAYEALRDTDLNDVLSEATP